MKIANKDARSYVQSQHPFEGSNLYAQFKPEGDGIRYIVYSYGEHFPMFIHCNGTWYENEDRYSRTTSKHRSQCHPLVTTVKLTTEWMKRLAYGGFQAIAKDRVVGEV